MLTYPVTDADIIRNSFVHSLVVNSMENKIAIIPVEQTENESYLGTYDAGLSCLEHLSQKIIKKFIIGHLIRRGRSSFDGWHIKVLLPSYDE